jgi:2'-5' RNA ligase
VSDERARLFAALELPPAARQTLSAWAAETLAALEGLRVLAADGLHMTLCFLGWQDFAAVEAIAAACDAVAEQPPARLEVGKVVWLPRRRPRVVAIELADPDGTAAAIQARLAASLAAGGWYAPEQRRWLAHVTVARTSRVFRSRPPAVDPPPPLTVQAGSVVLWRSRLERARARYERLRSVSLAGRQA